MTIGVGTLEDSNQIILVSRSTSPGLKVLVLSLDAAEPMIR